MGTYLVSQYEGWVRDRLDDTGFSGALLLQFARAVNADIVLASKRWPFRQQVFKGTAAGGYTNFDMPDAVGVPLNLTLYSPSGQRRRMPFKDYLEYDDEYPNPSALAAAPPSFWSRFGSQFILGPGPLDQSYSFQLRYLSKPAAVATDSATIDVPDEYWELVVFGMMVRAHKFNDEADLAQEVLINDYQPALEAMKDNLLTIQEADSARIDTGRRRNEW